MYLYGLSDAPAYVLPDEMLWSLHAHSLATTGHDLDGQHWPMYVRYLPQFGRLTWLPPMLTYAITAAVKVLPLSETTVRLPLVIAGIADVLLLYFIARLLFGREQLAVAGAIALALTPMHFVYSRIAIDVQVSLPFILAWFLGVAAYLREPDPKRLFLAGLAVGVGLFGYIGTTALLGVYALGTLVFLSVRRVPFRHHLVFAAGVSAPIVLGIPWLFSHRLPFEDVARFYVVLSPSESRGSGVPGLVNSFFAFRLKEFVSLYASYWTPACLFVDGPFRFRLTLQIGVFLVPLAGVIVCGFVRAMHRRSPSDILLLGAFLCAPLPASFTGEGQVIWRALSIVPFGILLGVAGLDAMWNADATDRRKRTVVLVTFGLAIALAIVYHDTLPRAQAIVRLSTAPLALIAAAATFRQSLNDDAPRVRERTTVAIGIFVIATVAFASVLVPTVVQIGFITTAAVGIGLWLTSDQPDTWLPAPSWCAVAFGALASVALVYYYVDFPVRRIGAIPASIVLAAARSASAFLLFGASMLFVDGIGRVRRRAAPFDRAERSPRHVLAGLALLGAAQLAYFYIDASGDYRVRLLQLAIVVLTSAAFLLSVRPWVARDVRLDAFAVGGVAVATVVVFGYFYHHYFTEYQVWGSGAVAGNVRVAWERVLDRAQRERVPAIYASEPRRLDDFYWRFYLIKHRREDLLDRTTFGPASGIDRDFIRTLPPRSIVVARASADGDDAVSRMVEAGELNRDGLARAADGTPIMWILVRPEHAPPSRQLTSR